jgi:riboflavin biosynthesis pyrimidine reductase
VLASRLDIPPSAKLLRNGGARGLVVFRAGTDPRDPEAAAVDSREAALSALGVRVVAVPRSADGGLDLRSVLEKLHSLSVRSVLVEGGAEVFSSFVREKLYQKISVFVAPIMVGDGLGTLGNLGVDRISAAPRLARVRYARIGDQMRVSGYREETRVHGHR